MTGRKYKHPSVTQVVTMHIDKKWFKPEYAHRGTMVHRACEANINKAWVMPMEDTHYPYYKSFKLWATEATPMPVKTEIFLEDTKLGFCGHPDFIGKMKDKKGIGVLDWKTSKKASPWWKLQISAYRHLFDIEFGNDCGLTEWGADVILNQDGVKGELYEVPRPKDKSDHESHLDTFLSLLVIYKHLKNIDYDPMFKGIVKSFKSALEKENSINSVEPSEVVVIRRIISKGIESILL